MAPRRRRRTHAGGLLRPGKRNSRARPPRNAAPASSLACAEPRDAKSFYVQVADLKGDAHAERTRREREERRLSMEREFREILPHTSIGKRRAGWEAPVYWKDKDPRAPPPDASGGSDAAALCAAAAAARREAVAARGSGLTNR